MLKKEIIARVERFVRQKLQNDVTGHGYWHIKRVRRLAKKIGQQEKADLFIVELASLLHDLDDWKFKKNDNLKKIKKLMLDLYLEKKIINQVFTIVKNVSFLGYKVKTNLPTIEAKVVYDADKLDAIGAIGIARIFATGALRRRALYDPTVPLSKKVGDYRKRDSYSSVHHFYDKILLLPEKMQTKTGKNMAKVRIKFVKKYLKQFYEEWKGVNII